MNRTIGRCDDRATHSLTNCTSVCSSSLIQNTKLKMKTAHHPSLQRLEDETLSNINKLTADGHRSVITFHLIKSTHPELHSLHQNSSATKHLYTLGYRRTSQVIKHGLLQRVSSREEGNPFARSTTVRYTKTPTWSLKHALRSHHPSHARTKYKMWKPYDIHKTQVPS